MKLEVYFDYACPYCLRGHDDLLSVLPEHPAVEVEWRPCEAHPRPEPARVHSDLCARGMYAVQELGGDVMAYHRIMYSAALVERAEIERPEVLGALAGELVDAGAFRAALADGRYLDRLAENNRLAWSVHRFAAVPSLRAGDAALRAVVDVGLTAAMIGEFLSGLGG